MSSYPLMPKATAMWLIDNTSLTFKQIADFCGLHILEIEGMADGDVLSEIKAMDPIISNQLTKEEIERCSKDPEAKLKLNAETEQYIQKSLNQKGKYIPIARRRDKPDAILWLLKSYPNISDAQVIKLIRTTKATVQSIRDKTYWNIGNLKPRDPVFLGLCTQQELETITESILEKPLEKNIKNPPTT